MLGDVQRERLAEPAGHGEHVGVLLARAIELAEGDEPGDAPLARVDLQLVVAEPHRQVAGLGEHVDGLREPSLVA